MYLIILKDTERERERERDGRIPLNELSARCRKFYLTTHNTHETDIHAPGEIRTRNPSKQAVTYPRFRQRGHGTSLFIKYAV